jgi:hypothetical protein
MYKSILNFGLSIFLLILLTIEGNAQSLSTGTLVLEDYYRRLQLLGKISTDHSFVSYPLFPVEAFGKQNPFDPENNLKNSRFTKFDGNIKLFNSKYVIKLLPFTWKNQYNSHHPEGINDGPMIPSKGYQTMISTGFYFESDHLSIKIQPEFVSAINPDYDGFPLTRKEQYWADKRWGEYYDYFLNYIDLPERFGENSYNEIFWGQSSIRLTLNSISLGFSTENLWWGPGMRNSLLMTNSAPGFAHLTLNSVKPIKTPIGSFEGQIIAGWLKESGYPPPNYWGVLNYVPKRSEGRYINGMIISYQPKWVPGLFIGLIRSFQIYHKDMDDGLIDYFPVFSAFSRKNAEDEEGEIKKYDSYNSIFLRFVWPESHVEIYGEYGRSDYYWDKRDFILEPEHSNAYNLGFRKLIPIGKHKDEYIQVHMELTQLAKNETTILRKGHSWYASGVVRHGYTHKGQYLGAGIGSASNLQTLNISWIRSLKMIGFQFERYAHNEDFFFERIWDLRAHWVDISAAFTGNWDYKNLLFSLKLKAVVSKNYQWEFDPDPTTAWGAPSPDTFNFHGQLGIMYRF